MNSGPRITLDDSGTLDDFFARDVKLFHLESVDESRWCIAVTLSDGRTWQINLGAVNPRAHGYARAEQIE